MKLSEAISHFIDCRMVDGKRERTIHSYARDLNLLVVFTNDADVSSLTPDLLSSFFLSEVARLGAGGVPRAPVSINRIKASVRSFCLYLVEAHNVDPNPARTIKIRRPGKKVVSALTADERNALIEAVKAHCCPRDLAMLTLFVNTGIRLSELVNLDIGDVDMTRSAINITAKGGNAETKFMNETARTVLAAYLDNRKTKQSANLPNPPHPSHPALFLSNRRTRISARQVQMRFSKWLDLAGLDRPGITVHTLRHTFGTLLYKQTKDLMLVKRAMGHSNIESTLVYLHMDDEEVRAAVEGL